VRAVTRYEWLLFLHLIGAFAAVASVVVFTVIVVGVRSGGSAALALTPLGRRLFDIGGGLTLVFGIWLALDVDGYGLLDGWILAAIVLWVIAAGTGARVGAAYTEYGAESDAPPRMLVPYLVMALATTALLVDMIFKPGA
jgi:uncharacterized membrane protein